ncbi:cell division protein FtsW, partial [Salmonella enterica subsp. enterica serovar Infantis]
MATYRFFFAKGDALYIFLAFCLALFTLGLPMTFWKKYSTTFRIATINMHHLDHLTQSTDQGDTRSIPLGKM